MTAPTPNSMPQQAQSGTGGSPDEGQQGAGSQGGSQQQPDPNAPVISQSHMNYLLAEQKRELTGKYADYDERGQKAQAYDALIATTRTTEEQAADLAAKLATTERTKAESDTTILRYKMAGAAQLPADLWDMVGGTDESSIKANIEKLKQFVTPANPDNGNDGGQHDQQQQSKRRPAPVKGQGQAGNGGSGGVTGNGMTGGRDLFRERHGKKSGAAAQ